MAVTYCVKYKMKTETDDEKLITTSNDRTAISEKCDVSGIKSICLLNLNKYSI